MLDKTRREGDRIEETHSAKIRYLADCAEEMDAGSGDPTPSDHGACI